MHTKSLAPARQLPRYPVRFALGMLILLITLLLLVTAVASTYLEANDSCHPGHNQTNEEFSPETAVPDCWLVQ